jgi:type I restriction enzyme S subunit
MTDGYPVCRLGAVASVQGGFAFKSGDFIETGVPVLKIKNVRLREVDTTEPAHVDQSVAKDTARYFCKTGDLLISMTGSGPQAPNSVVGRVARFTGPSDKYLINQRVGRFVNQAPDKLDQRYLFYVLAQDETLWQLVSVATGSANQANISGSQIESLEVPLPPLADQKAIAAVLGALDDKIELNRRMNETLEAMARALFQSWFVDFDPVRAKLDGRPPAALDPATAALFPEHLEETAIGHTPKGWEVKRINEVVEEVFDGPHATPPDVAEGPVFLGIKNLTGSALDLTDIRHISESDWPRWTKRVMPRPLDIVFSYEATLGFFALIPPGLRCCLGRRLALIRPNAKDGHSHFWFHQFIGPDFQRYLMQHSVQGATVDRIPLIQFPNYLVLNPPPSLKEAFESRVAPLWAKIHSNADQSRTLATLRDTLLPKLLSGELSLSALEVAR